MNFANSNIKRAIDYSHQCLNSLNPGESGTIVDIHSEGSLKLHLMELGFVRGSQVTFLMSTPFGDPNIYSIRGTNIALRNSEAQCILVKK